MKFTSLIFMAVPLAAAVANASPRCESLFSDTTFASLPADPLDQLARFQIEIDAMADAVERVTALDDLRAKFKELAAKSGPDFRERFIARVEALRRGEPDAQKEKDDQARDIQTKRDELTKWTRATKNKGMYQGFLGDKLLMVSQDSNLGFYDRESRTMVTAPAFFPKGLSSYDTRAALSPDKNHMILVDAENMVVKDLVSGVETSFPQSRSRAVDAIRFSADGKKVYISDYMDHFEVYEFPSMKIYATVAYRAPSFHAAIRESATGEFLFVDRGAEYSFLYDLSNLRKIELPEQAAENLAGGFFSPDGRKFVFLNRQGRWGQIDLQTKKLDRRAYIQSASMKLVSEMHYSPDGLYVAIQFSNALEHITRIFDLKTGAEIKIEDSGIDLKGKSLSFVWGRDSLFIGANGGFPVGRTQTDLYRLPTADWKLQQLAIPPTPFDRMYADPVRDTLYVHESNMNVFYEIH